MNLGNVLRKYRMSQEFTLREMARDMKISFSTLHRIESGNSCDSETLVRLIVWLNSPETAAKARQ